MLTTVGGPALALATGVLLGAAARRTPVFIDGALGAAAALAARDWAAQVRLWCALVDIGGDATVKAAADRLGTTPIFVGILTFHIFLAPSTTAPGLVLFVLELFLAWVYRDAFRPLLMAKTPI
jgi:hypothetical protein